MLVVAVLLFLENNENLKETCSFFHHNIPIYQNILYQLMITFSFMMLLLIISYGSLFFKNEKKIFIAHQRSSPPSLNSVWSTGSAKFSVLILQRYFPYLSVRGHIWPWNSHSYDFKKKKKSTGWLVMFHYNISLLPCKINEGCVPWHCLTK